MKNEEAIDLLARELELSSKTESAEKLREEAIEKVRYLILHDMPRLTSILYRVDVDENKLRSVLELSRDSDTAPIITDLILERQAQKLASRRANSGKKDDNDIPGIDKW